MSENIEIKTNSINNDEEVKIENDNEKKIENVENEIKKVAAEENSPKYNLSKFSLKQILSNNTKNKTITLLGSFPDISNDDQAIIVFEKEAFLEHEVQTPNADKNLEPIDTPVDSENDRNDSINKSNSCLNSSNLNKSYFNDELEVQTEFINNIYGNFRCIPSDNLNTIKTTVIYPANDKHIEKYNITQKYLVTETPALYKNLTLPYLTSRQFSLEWVYNILEHKQEAERIVFEDTDPEIGFTMVPDMKWSGKNLENMYYLAIVRKHGIKSLRDLSAEHLPLLRNIRNKASDAIEKLSGLKLKQLRMYIHYQPSFYHLHIHINPIRNDAPGIFCEKSHLLDMVINNIELMPDYYQRSTLQFILFEGSKLLERYDEETVPRKRRKISNREDDEVTDAKKSKILAEKVIEKESSE